MVRSRDAVNAIELAKSHLDQAAKERPELLESTFYIRLLSNHGIAYVAVERYAESEEFHRQAIEHCERLGMEKECSMGNLMQNLGSCYLWGGDLQRAYDILQEALLQPNVNREGAQYTLGNVMLRLKKYDEAIALHKEALQVYLKEIGPSHPTTGDSWHKIGTIFAMPEFSGHDLHEAE
jgi:tetratricopeptide (TPR) repeat protein